MIANLGQLSFAKLRTRLLWSLPLALAVVVGLLLYADARQVSLAFLRFRWELLPLILGLTLFNYALRFVKWHFYLGQIGVRGLPWSESLGLFLSGLSMVITPGKVGEWLKCYLLRERTGTPFSRSAPIIVAERLTDGVALIFLALWGLLLSGEGWPMVVIAGLLAAAVVIVVRWPLLAFALLGVIERVPVLRPLASALRELWASAALLFTARNLALAIGLGVVSWAGESLAFFLVLVGLGLPPSGLLVIQAAFILSVSVLGSSLVLLPGGLGFAEGGITGLSQWLLGMDKGPAAAAALLIRFCTLWFGIALGLIALTVMTRRLLRQHSEVEEQLAL